MPGWTSCTVNGGRVPNRWMVTAVSMGIVAAGAWIDGSACARATPMIAATTSGKQNQEEVRMAACRLCSGIRKYCTEYEKGGQKEVLYEDGPATYLISSSLPPTTTRTTWAEYFVLPDRARPCPRKQGHGAAATTVP